jgi:hypothetical protein
MEQPTAAEAVPPGPAPTPQPQRVDWYWFIGFIVCMVLTLILVYGVLMACALGGEILAGKPGGLAGVCAPVLLLFLVAIIWRLAKKR